MNDTDDIWTSNTLSRSLLESLDQGVIGLDNQHRIKVWNTWMTNHTGLKTKALKSRRFQEAFPDLPSSTLETIKRVMNTGLPLILSPAFHSNWFPPVGVRHQFVRLLPLLTKDSGISGVLILIQNVSGAVEDEERLSGRYRSLVESFSDHIFMLGRDGTYLASNNPTTQYALQNGEDLVGKHYSDVLADDVAEQYREQTEKLLATGQSVQFEHEVSAPDSLRYHMDTLYPVFRDNSLWTIGGTCRDITETKIYEKELLIRTRITSAFLTTQGDEIFGEVLKIVLDASESRCGVFGYINEDGALACPSKTGEIWEKRPISDKTIVFPPERWDEIWGRALIDLKTFCSNTPSTVPEGHHPILRSLASPVIHEGKAIGVLYMANRTSDYSAIDLQLIETIANTIAPMLHSRHQLNIKEKEKNLVEEQLHQSQKMEAFGLLAGSVAHDFNNHLSVILGNADIISLEMSGRSSYKENIEGITKAARSAASLTRQLLIFGHKNTALPEVISINDVIIGIEKMLQRLLREDIRFVTAKSNDLEPVLMDPGQLEQVIMNIVINARDAMPKGGLITIETANLDLEEAFFRAHGCKPAAGPYVLLSVSDSGVGMDGETRSRIFEPFFTTKKRGQGTGLGLATVYGLVKQAEGYVWAYSEPGKGTTFKIYIPVTGKRAETGGWEVTESRAKTEGTETILLVEDDETVRNLMGAILKRYGYQVLLAEDGEKALALSQKHEGEIALLLTDVVLPGIGGKEMSDALQEKRPDMKILFVSGYPEDIISSFGVVPSDMNFMTKPIIPESLALKIREVLDKK